MLSERTLERVARSLGKAVEVDAQFRVRLQDPSLLGERIEALVKLAVFGEQPERSMARWLVRECALQAGILPSSIHDLYLARGRGDTRTDFTVPAINLRALPFHAAKAVFRAARQAEARAIIFEIARSEIGYTDQRPSEYASCVLGAAIAEGYRGPVFIQGDHFQASASRYAAEPEAEMQELRSLIEEAIAAGFFNIDIDTSTLVDLAHESIPEQQSLNYSLSAELTAHARSLEPAGVTLSIGGEIGEVGKHNSTEPELVAFMDGFNRRLAELAPHAAGLSKISIQTGTSHGGVVLPDGSVAEAKVDFGTLRELSIVARREYGMAGAVQHGASTLPEQAFSRFAEAQACEVHLATNFQNIFFDLIPDALRDEIYDYLRSNHQALRKRDQTDEQFYYTTRKQALGPFKRQLWQLPSQVVAKIEGAWEEQFSLLFERLNVSGTSAEVEQFIRPVAVHTAPESYLREISTTTDVTDLDD